MRLHLIDCSNYIYAGDWNNLFITRGVREIDGEFAANDAPIGGVDLLLNKVFQLSKTEDDIVMPVFDRTPTVKREMYETLYGANSYKGNRGEKLERIEKQKQYAESILRSIGYNVQAVDGYEADDVIYTLVKMYKSDFDEIYIYTRDSDLRFLVSDKVTIKPVTKKDKEINIINYERSVDPKNHTLYNTVHLRKMCAGDTSDNISGVGWEWATPLDNIMIKEDYPKLGDLDFARKKIIEAVTKNPNLINSHKVLSTFNLIVPLIVPYDEIDDSEPMINEAKVQYFKNMWEEQLDKWGYEDELREYINSYYE